MRVAVDVGHVDPDGLGQPLTELYRIVQAPEPHHAPGQRLGSEYLEATVPVQVVHTDVGGRMRLSVGEEHGV